MTMSWQPSPLVAAVLQLLALQLLSPSAAFVCDRCESQIFTESGTLSLPGGSSVFAVAVGGGAGGGQSGGGCSGVAASGMIMLAGATTPVAVGAGGTGYRTMGTVGYNGGDNNLADDVEALNGGATSIGWCTPGGDGHTCPGGLLTANGGEQAYNGRGGSGGGHSGTPNGNGGGSGGADGSGPCCFGAGQGSGDFQASIALTGLEDTGLGAGAGGTGGFRDDPGAEAGGGGGGGVLLNGGGPSGGSGAEDTANGADDTISGNGGAGFGAGGGAGGGAEGYRYFDAGDGVAGLVIIAYCPAGHYYKEDKGCARCPVGTTSSRVSVLGRDETCAAVADTGAGGYDAAAAAVGGLDGASAPTVDTNHVGHFGAGFVDYQGPASPGR